MPLTLPARHTERDEIETAAQKLQKRAFRRVAPMRRNIATVLCEASAGVALDLLLRGIQHHDTTLIEEAIPKLDLGPHVPVRKAEGDTPSPVDDLQTATATTFTEGATAAISFFPSLELVDQHAVDFARESAGKFFSDLDAQALANAREAIAWGIENGRTVDQTARFLQSTMYLPERGMNAVENYFNGLIAQVEKGKDLAEAARAEGKSRALAPTKFLDATNIDTLVDRYADRWIDYTAETVARTMTIEASNAGLIDGWQEAAQAGYFDPSTATLIWYATDDDITCPICEDLNDTEVDFDGGTFDTQFGATDAPPAHMSCRCTLVLITNDGSTEEVPQ